MPSSSKRLRLGAALFAGVLAVAVGVATPALAHGDRHDGGSGSGGRTQGSSRSNPDGGGVDKPYPAAGQDARTQGSSDWDGNNGCGNDDDRADDNNGWCGRHKSHDQAKVNASRAAKVKSAEQATPEVKDTTFVLDETVSRCRRERIAVNRVEKEFCSCDHFAVPTDTTLSAESVKAFEAKKAEILAAKAAALAAAAQKPAAAPATETVAVAAPGAVLGTEITRAAAPAGSELAAAGATTAAAPAAAPATNGPATEVLGVSLNRAAPTGTADTSGNVLGSVASLAFTGTDSMTLLLMAIALIAIGLIVSRYSARRSS
ncbi:MAG: hypothetical protein QOF60_1272 [Actinomycetota bacterium]|jgi:hypothetical protein|nr:hypothetical protein [Actinomycetota bacterium]